MKKMVFLFFVLPCVLYAGTFTEDFSSLTYIDTTATTATINTTDKLAKLPYVSSFTDLCTGGTSITAYFGTNGVYSISYAGSKWLIAGAGGKLASYDGTTFLDLYNALFISTDINSIFWGMGTYYLLGAVGPKLNQYAPELYYNNITSQLTSFSPETINAIGWGTYWLVGGNNGKLNRWDGSGTGAFTDLTASAAFGTENINAIGWNGSYWLVGGANSTITTNRLKKYDGTTFTDLTTDLNWAAEKVYAIGWNGSYWLIGGTSGNLAKYDGTTFTSTNTTFQTSLGGNFSTNTVRTIVWNGVEWLIGGGNGRLTTWDGNGVTNSNFKGIGNGSTPNLFATASSWGTNEIRSIYWNGTSCLIGGAAAKLNLISAIYNGTDAKVVISKKVNSGAGRIYKAKLTSTEELNGQTLKYYVSADGSTHWNEVANTVETTIPYTGNNLMWKASLEGKFGSPKVKNPLTIDYTICDESILPGGLGGDFTSTTDTETKISVEPGAVVYDTKCTLTKDANPPASLVTPKSPIVAYDIVVKNYATDAVVEVLATPLNITMHWQSADGTYVENTGNSVLLLNAKSQLTLAFWNGLHWVPISSTVTTAGNNIYVSAKVLHLSKFGIVVASPTNTASNCEPNPFTPTGSNSAFNKVKVSFLNADNSSVEFKIWDITGCLVYEAKADGISSLSWDGKDKAGRFVESGVYIYEVKVGGSSRSKGTIAVGR